MTKYELWKMAVDSDICDDYFPASHHLWHEHKISKKAIEKFAMLVTLKEREACAKVCDELDAQYVAFKSSAKECADRIRARTSMM